MCENDKLLTLTSSNIKIVFSSHFHRLSSFCIFFSLTHTTDFFLLFIFSSLSQQTFFRTSVFSSVFSSVFFKKKSSVWKKVCYCERELYNKKKIHTIPYNTHNRVHTTLHTTHYTHHTHTIIHPPHYHSLVIHLIMNHLHKEEGCGEP